MPQLDNIAVVLGAILATGLAMQAGLGPMVMYLTEAIKGAVQPPEGYGGMIATVTAVALGAVLGALTASLTDQTGYGTYTLLGAVLGLFVAAGAVSTHKAAGTVNTDVSRAVADDAEGRLTTELDAASERFSSLFTRPVAVKAPAGSDVTVTDSVEVDVPPLRAERFTSPMTTTGDPTLSRSNSGYGAYGTPVRHTVDDGVGTPRPPDSPAEDAEPLDALIAAGPPAGGCTITPDEPEET